MCSCNQKAPSKPTWAHEERGKSEVSAAAQNQGRELRGSRPATAGLERLHRRELRGSRPATAGLERLHRRELLAETEATGGKVEEKNKGVNLHAEKLIFFPTVLLRATHHCVSQHLILVSGNKKVIICLHDIISY